MFYGLNGPPEIDAVLMFSNSGKKKNKKNKEEKEGGGWRGGMNVSALSVCTCLLANLCERAVRDGLCLRRLVCSLQMALSAGFAHANEAT